MMSRGTWPSMVDDLVADLRARPARPAIRARQRRLEARTCPTGYGPRAVGSARAPAGSLDPMDVDRVLLASPRGFCAGVEMAIKALAWMVRAFEPPVYCYHEIVHNQLVVERFQALGVVFVDDVAEVPAGRAAHAVGPRLGPRGRRRGPGQRAATSSTPSARWSPRCTTRSRCGPARATSIVYVGHEGHEEAVGTMAVAPDADPPRRVGRRGGRAARRSTSRSRCSPRPRCRHRDWADVLDATRERFPDLWMPGRSDLCFATTNRQSALMAIAPRCDAVVVIGSANSSNTRALEKLARDAGCPRVYRVNDADELPDDLAGMVGVTAGASAPEELVEAVIARLAPARGRRGGHASPTRTSTSRRPATSATCWPPSTSCATFALGGPVSDRPPINDRALRGQRRAGHPRMSRTPVDSEPRRTT